jgi:hypothetical protein
MFTAQGSKHQRNNTMSTKMFYHDEISALAYESNQMADAGYAHEAQLIRRQAIDLSPVFDQINLAVASLFRRDLPAALAYETNQMAAADDRVFPCPDTKDPSFLEKVTAWAMRKPVTSQVMQTAPCGS